MADDLERLKAIRGGHRGVATKLIRQGEEILESTFLFTEDYEHLCYLSTTGHEIATTKQLRPANPNRV